MRWLGIDENVHRSLGGWAALSSAKEYMQLTPAEQFRVTKALALKRKRDLACEVQGDVRS